MFFTYNGKDLAFKFKHNTFQPITETDAPRGTECTVVDKEGNFIAKAWAKLHPKDVFNKEKGRQVALGKVLQEFVPKEDRLSFWTAYSVWRSKEPRMVLGTKKVRKTKLKIV